ncbi:MAG: type II toxin-antitoxin system RelE/ParE family toxin [Oceanicaulis sp.]|nr:type II toxin-antitoxin system RelE/ParE family toxin [Oceanicaulis sp.]
MGPCPGKAYLTDLEQACLKLASNPEMGAPDPVAGAGYRRFLAGRHWLYYTPIEGGVRVMAVMHARPKPGP